VAIKGGIADARSACDIVEARSGSIAGEDLLGYLKNALAVALRVSPGFAGRRCRRRLLLDIRAIDWELQTGTFPVYIFSAYGDYPRFIR
jgi:hypothetical protein